MTFQGLPLSGSVLAAAMALILWTLVVWVWMYATRLPAMGRMKIAPQDARFPGDLDVLPDGARQAANNYNHLMEQPTLFYALAFLTYLLGQQSSFTAGLAWAYVALRVVHSLIQITVNLVPVRFLVFTLSSLVLMVWAGWVVLAVMA